MSRGLAVSGKRSKNDQILLVNPARHVISADNRVDIVIVGLSVEKDPLRCDQIEPSEGDALILRDFEPNDRF